MFRFRFRRLCRIGLLLTLVCFVGGGAWAFESLAVDEKWRHYSSPNFELYSRNDDDASRELLHNLELLRAVFLEQLKVQERVRVPVTVYYFRSRSDFQAYAPEALRRQDSLAGFYLFRPDRAVISMAPADDSDAARQTIFHEYVHHLFRIAEYDPPLWFNEGMAEVLAGMKVERSRVVIGSPLDSRVIYLRQEKLLPLEELFAASHSSKAYTDEKHTGVFYAQSWALLHYWRFGQSKIPREAVDKFLSVAADREKAAATDLEQHFRASFGMDYREMQRRLTDYVRSGRFRASAQPLPAIAAPSSYARRAVALDEITVRLAELSLRVEQSARARWVLLDAIEKRPEDPRLLEVLGSDAYLGKDEQTATEQWERALAAGSTNTAIIRELALMEGRRWFARFDEDFQLPRDTADRMRSRLLRSIEFEPQQGAAYEMLAWVEAFAEAPVAENVHRVIAQMPAIREKKRTLIALAWLMLRVGNGSNAASLIEHLDSLRLEDDEANALSSLRARLTEEYPDVANNSAEGSSAAQAIEPPPSSPGLKTPSVALPDDL